MGKVKLKKVNRDHTVNKWQDQGYNTQFTVNIQNLDSSNNFFERRHF